MIVTSRSPATIEGVAEVITGNRKTENSLGRLLLFSRRPIQLRAPLGALLPICLFAKLF